jgi:D-aminopeptidase
MFLADHTYCAGDRPVPSCLGGGDLDGDVYNLIPLVEFPQFKPTRIYTPAKYNPVLKKLLDHPSTMADVAEFVMEYINSDVSCRL